MEHSASHPSDSIPNAAYPEDSSYRPSDSTHTLELGVVSPHQQSPSTTYQAQHPQQQYAATIASPGSPWQNDPLEPPPPYDPSRVPSSFSQPSGSSSSYLQRPASTYSPPEQQPQQSTYSPPQQQQPFSQRPYTQQQQSSYSLQQQRPPYSPSTSQAPPSPYSTQSSHFRPYPGKLGPVAEARRRRRQRQICLAVLAGVGIFVVAVVIGIALGVLKDRFKGHDDNNNGGGNNNNPP